MRTVVIRAIDAVKCIRSGMTDAALMDEFQVSARGLRKLFKELLMAGILTRDELAERVGLSYGSVIVDIEREKLPFLEFKKPVIDALDALNCLRSGMSDADLMKRYNLSAKGIQSLMSKLVSAGVISPHEADAGGLANRKSIVLDEEDRTPPALQKEDTDLDSTEVLSHLRAGMTHESIVEGYGISRKDLDDLLDGLVEQGIVTQIEVDRSLREPLKQFEIKHRYSTRVMYSGEAPSFAALVESAVRAGIDLSESDMAGMNLARAALSGAQLMKADMRRVNLVRADLTGAKLTGATLASADMTGAILYKANLAQVDFSDANMSMVHAVWAFLSEANLSETNLTNADLYGANLAGAQMFETILSGTILTGAYLKKSPS
jgi:uncharacterized protein YjbI with pentapeptide repeats/uncharacterized protein (DUF433 family)